MLYIFGDDIAVPLTRENRQGATRYNNARGHNKRTAAPRGWNQLTDLGDSWNDLDKQYSRLENDLGQVFRALGIPVPENATRRRSVAGQKEGNNKENVGEEGKAQEDNMYRLNIYMGEEFEPENIKISLKEHVLTVEAKREQKSEDGNSRFYEEVSRKFTIPDSVDLKEVKSVFAPNGILRIEAPLPKQPLLEPPKPVSIPINLE